MKKFMKKSMNKILGLKNNVEEVVYNESVAIVEDSLENVLENSEFRSFDYRDSNSDGLVDSLELYVSDCASGISHSLGLNRGDDFKGFEDFFLEADSSYQKQVKNLNDSGKLNALLGNELELARRISINYNDWLGDNLVDRIAVYTSSSLIPHSLSLHLKRENDFEEYKDVFLEADRYSVVQSDRFSKYLN